MVERLNGIQKVWGSTPHTSTILKGSGIRRSPFFVGGADAHLPFAKRRATDATARAARRAIV